MARHVRSSDGTLIHAEAVGCSRNPHVVFIHEATMCSSVFDDLFRDARLTELLYLVRYDLRCHGRSGVVKGAEGQRSTQYANDYSAVASTFGLRSPILVAWGFGAAVVADICAHVSPLAISGIIYVSPFPFLGRMITQTASQRMLGIVQALATSRDAGSSGRAKTDFVDGILAGPPRRIPDTLKASWLGRSISQDADITALVFSRQHDPTKLAEAGRRGLPLMLLLGSQDLLVDNTAVARELRRHFRNAEVHVIAESSHALFVDEKDEFVRLLLMFMGRLAVMTLMG